MNTTRLSLLAALVIVAVASVGCGNKDEEAPSTQPPDSNTSSTPKTSPKKPDVAANVAHAADVWKTVGSAYRSWTAHTAQPVKGQRPHGAFIQVYYNDVAKSARGGRGAWPDGAVIVKDNYMPNAAKNGPGMLAMVTVMQKESGRWFWAKYKPDGTLDKLPATAPMPNMPIAGYAGLKCISCHTQSQSRDKVVTNLAMK